MQPEREVIMVSVKYLRTHQVDESFDQVSQKFLSEVSKNLEQDLVIDQTTGFAPDQIKLFFIASGGTEELFVTDYGDIEGPVFLLTMERRNSLAAAMEILTWLQKKGITGQILHGTTEELAQQLNNMIQIQTVKQRLKTFKLGVTEPSGWLIASQADRNLVKQKSGIEIVDLSMSELRAEINKKTYPEDDWTRQLAAKSIATTELEKALHIYGGVKRLADKYGLQGISIKCFDLLEPYQTSGCLALGLLNAAGYHAACEGDELSLISMTVLAELTSQPIFMSNPARLDLSKREIVLAHCVLPLNMPTSYQLMTHYESGIGLAIAGELDHDRYTVFKMKDNFTDYIALEGQLVENLHEGDMCRTQIKLRLDEPLDYFLKRPIANHHMVVRGGHKALIKAFFDTF